MTEYKGSHCYLVTKDLGWWPVNQIGVGVDTVNQKLSSPTNIVDRIVRNTFNSGSLDLVIV